MLTFPACGQRCSRSPAAPATAFSCDFTCAGVKRSVQRLGVRQPAQGDEGGTAGSAGRFHAGRGLATVGLHRLGVGIRRGQQPDRSCDPRRTKTARSICTGCPGPRGHCLSNYCRAWRVVLDDFRYHSIDLEPTGDRRIERDRAGDPCALAAGGSRLLPGALERCSVHRTCCAAPACRTHWSAAVCFVTLASRPRGGHAGSVYNRFLLSDRSGDSWNRETETSPSLSRYRVQVSPTSCHSSRGSIAWVSACHIPTSIHPLDCHRSAERSWARTLQAFLGRVIRFLIGKPPRVPKQSQIYSFLGFDRLSPQIFDSGFARHPRVDVDLAALFEQGPMESFEQIRAGIEQVSPPTADTIYVFRWSRVCMDTADI